MAAPGSQQRHRSVLKKYLQAQSAPAASTRQVKSVSNKSQVSADLQRPHEKNQRSSTERNTNMQSTIRSSVRLPHIPAHRGRMKATIESLPDEVLSLIFWKLKAGDLISASQVCHRWHRVSADNLLWKNLYARFVGTTSKEKEDKISLNDLETGCWKKLCVHRCKVKRDKKYLKNSKFPDPYTGLKQKPDQVLDNIGTRFDLSFICTEGAVSTFQHCDIFWSTLSVSVRWYGLVLPDVKDITCIQIHACTPLMLYGPSQPATDGIIQRSKLLECTENIKHVLQKQSPIGCDSQIQVFELTKGLMISTYKADGEIAFVTCAFHYHNLVPRCLCGGSNRLWCPPKAARLEDDIDQEYGLHDYTCVIIIRNMRQKFLECRFTQLYTRVQALADGFATFNPVKKDDKQSHISLLREISFPWKTTLFKGILKNVGILDLTLLDQNGEVFWATSAAISVKRCTETNQFDFDPNTYRTIHYEDNIGKLCLEIGKLDNSSQYLSSVSVSLSLTAINKAFKTLY